MSASSVTFVIIGAMVAMFVSGRVPVAVAALLAALAFFATGVLDLHQALRGFGDPTVLFIASLLVVSASLEETGVTTWAGQLLIGRAGASERRLLILTTLSVTVLTALIGPSGAVAALLPMVVLVAVRLGRSPSQLLMPLVFAAHAASTLVLTSSLVNLVASDAATQIGEPAFGYFELTAIGLPLAAGTILIIVLLAPYLVPRRASRQIPGDLSRHSSTLAEQYNLFQDLYQVVLPAGVEAMAASSLLAAHEDELSLIAVRGRDGRAHARNTPMLPGDSLLLRGNREAVSRFAEERRFVLRDTGTAAEMRRSLFNTAEGFAEAVVPPRSALIGDAMFPGMITPGGDLIVLAIQRHGETLGPGETTLIAGDSLLLQGSWEALEALMQDPDILVVDRPDLMRRQAISLGTGARRALTVLAATVLLLATGIVPAVVAGLLAACALVLLRVLTVEQAYRAINWTAIIMIAALIPLSTAMYKSGAAHLIADALVSATGDRSPYALLGGLFVLTAGLTQLISSTATALIITPAAISAAAEIGVSPRTMLVVVVVGAASCFLTPISGAANLIVQGPAGYRFGDYWRLGLPLMAWFFSVATIFVPLIWPL